MVGNLRFGQGSGSGRPRRPASETAPVDGGPCGKKRFPLDR